MRKKICIICISIFILFHIFNIKVFAVKCRGVEIELSNYYRDEEGTGVHSTEVASILNKWFGYEGDDLATVMKFNTKIQITQDPHWWNGHKYTIRIGEKIDEDGEKDYEMAKKISGISEEDLKNIYGYDGENEEWDVILVVSCVGAYKDDNGNRSFDRQGKYDIGTWGCTIIINEIYGGSEQDYNQGKRRTVNGEKIHVDINSPTEDYVEIKDTYEKISKSETAKRFAKNPYGFALTYLYNGLRYVFGDLPLTFAHAITFSDTKFMYGYDQLNTDEYDSIDKYTKVSKYKKREKRSWQKEINIKNENDYKDEEYRRFSSSTEIPVITMDLYNIAADNIEFFDTNFFQVDKERHPEESPTMWLNLRDFAMSISHATIYLATAFLVIILIINGIQIVRHTFDNPEAKAEHIKSLRRFAMSLLLLVGTILIMTLCTYGSKALLKVVKVENRTELPIRIDVEEAEYSFSTNITGYFRYMSGIEGIHNYREKGMYTIIYIIIAWVDVALTVFMTLRTYGLMILAIAGPILAVLYSLDMQGAMRYKAWVKAYVKLSFVQIIFAVIYRVIFQFTI